MINFDKIKQYIQLQNYESLTVVALALCSHPSACQSTYVIFTIKVSGA